MVRSEGLEPSRLAAQDPKSCVSAISPAARMFFPPPKKTRIIYHGGLRFSKSGGEKAEKNAMSV